MAKSDEAEIRQLLGDKNGRQLYRYANGIDDSPVRSEREEAKGYSAETTVEEDIVTYEQALSCFLRSVMWWQPGCAETGRNAAVSR